MKIAIACDHAGYEYKEKLKNYLLEKGYEIYDCGCNSIESVDYPDYAHKLARSIEEGKSQRGVQFCGTGNGINMSVNKHEDIRSALCWNTHIAEQSRLHNNANVLTMPARHLKWKEIKEIVNVFLVTNFEGGRHERRVKKINK